MRTYRSDDRSTEKRKRQRHPTAQDEDASIIRGWDHVVAGKGERRYLEVVSMDPAGISMLCIHAVRRARRSLNRR
jgi:hypothetical protein